jgi:hypothetical protein
MLSNSFERLADALKAIQQSNFIEAKEKGFDKK